MSKKPILAAGVIVTDNNGDIALVYREAHGDWSFPKGKLDKPESIEECAVREGLEETGHLIGIDRLIGHTTYKSKGREKHVYYFAAVLLRKDVGPLAKDVQECRFFHPVAAMEHLTHKRDRKLLKSYLHSFFRDYQG